MAQHHGDPLPGGEGSQRGHQLLSQHEPRDLIGVTGMVVAVERHFGRPATPPTVVGRVDKGRPGVRLGLLVPDAGPPAGDPGEDVLQQVLTESTVTATEQHRGPQEGRPPSEHEALELGAHARINVGAGRKVDSSVARLRRGEATGAIATLNAYRSCQGVSLRVSASREDDGRGRSSDQSEEVANMARGSGFAAGREPSRDESGHSLPSDRSMAYVELQLVCKHHPKGEEPILGAWWIETRFAAGLGVPKRTGDPDRRGGARPRRSALVRPVPAAERGAWRMEG